MAGFCGHHDGQQKRRKAGSPEQEEGAGTDDEANFGSDDELGGGIDELQTEGADPKQSKSKDAHYRKAAGIKEAGFKAAFESVWHLKKKPEPPKPKVHQSETVPMYAGRCFCCSKIAVVQ